LSNEINLTYKDDLTAVYDRNYRYIIEIARLHSLEYVLKDYLTAVYDRNYRYISCSLKLICLHTQGKKSLNSERKKKCFIMISKPLRIKINVAWGPLLNASKS